MSVLSAAQCAFLEAVAGRLVPEAPDLDSAQKQLLFEIVEEVLSERPAALQRQLKLFLAVVRWLPALRYGAPLDRLDPARADAALRWFQDCPLPLVRKGFWGLKSLVFMGYYGRPSAGARLGYLPVRDGNAKLLAASPRSRT